MSNSTNPSSRQDLEKVCASKKLDIFTIVVALVTYGTWNKNEMHFE